MERDKAEMIKQWRVERDKALLAFDVDTFKEFYEKWRKLGVYSEPLPSDKVIEISIRKCVCEIIGAPKDKKEQAKKWLEERGYKPYVYQEEESDG